MPALGIPHVQADVMWARGGRGGAERAQVCGWGGGGAGGSACQPNVGLSEPLSVEQCSVNISHKFLADVVIWQQSKPCRQMVVETTSHETCDEGCDEKPT